MKGFKRIILAVAACVMAAALTACSDTTWVFDCGGQKVPSGVYIAYTMIAYQDVTRQEDYDAAAGGILDQTIEGQSAVDWIRATAREECVRSVAVEKKFGELGLSFSEEDLSAIDSVVEEFWAMAGETYERNGVSKESYRKVVESSRRESVLFKKYYDKDGIEEVKTEDLLAHFQENFASVNIFRVPYNTGSDLTDEEKTENEEIEEQVKGYVDMLNQENKPFGEVYDLFYHSILGTEHDSDSDTDIIYPDEDTRVWMRRVDDPNYSKRVTDSVFDEMKPDGDAKYIRDEDRGSYYVARRYDVTKDEKNFDEMRTAVLQDIKAEPFREMIDGWMAELDVTVNDSAVKRYHPKNIDLTSRES